MTFPVHFHVFGASVPAHAVFELLGYTGGFQLYLLVRRRGAFPRAAVGPGQTGWLLLACIAGAFVGSKLLALAELIPEHLALGDHNVSHWLAGKTIVGGLLGGWAAVEWAKRRLGLLNSTGDGYVLPLIAGMVVGRVGCFLGGLPDHTYGVACSLPWGVDFGDGIRRHPTQLYEVAFLLLLGLGLATLSRLRVLSNGVLFRLFMLAYLAWRLLVEFIKPRYPLPGVGVTSIQLAAMAGVSICLRELLRVREMPAVFAEIAPEPHATGGAA